MSITITIDGTAVVCNEGEYILDVARANDIYIPAICYLNRCSPTLACRICLVEADGKQVYACNAKAKDGMQVVTNNDEIHAERRAIMEVYDVNHPLECGVCDKSGECELQNNTLEQGVDAQHYAVRDTKRPIINWGFVKYDASLCIVCERCVTACKDMVGDGALKTLPRGGDELDKEYKESMPKNAYAMWNKLNKSIIGPSGGDFSTLDCSNCGECISVCPVGALTSPAFTYSSNAWELTKIPSSCSHCSNACHLTYEVKHTSIEESARKIYRVSNDWNAASLCGAGRFGFDYDNKATKNETQFNRALLALKEAKAINFSGLITNEEAFMLQYLKQTLGIKLLNPEVKAYQNFLANMSTTSGETLYNGTLKDVHSSNFIVTLGTRIVSDSPIARNALNNALTLNKGAGLYCHPIKDRVVDGFSKNLLHLAIKPMSEEAILYALIDLFVPKANLEGSLVETLASFHTQTVVQKTEKVKEKIKELVKEIVTHEDGTQEEIEKEVEKEITKEIVVDVTVDHNRLFELAGLSGDTATFIEPLLAKKDAFSLILGADLYTHPQADNIARLAGIFQRLSGFKVVVIPPSTNALGVSLICDLDDSCDGPVVGYNASGDFILTALGATQENELDMPALNQQEGTFVSIDKRLVPLNPAVDYHGFELLDLLNHFGFDKSLAIDVTPLLPADKGFKALSFDSLPNYFDNAGTEHRGYSLESCATPISQTPTPLSDIGEFNGTVLYRCNPVLHFSPFTAKCSALHHRATLMATDSFLEKHTLSVGDRVEIEVQGEHMALTLERETKVDGCVAMISTYEQWSSPLLSQYRFIPSTLKKVSL